MFMAAFMKQNDCGIKNIFRDRLWLFVRILFQVFKLASLQDNRKDVNSS